MTEAIEISSTELTQEDLQILYEKQTDLIADKVKFELVIGDILHAFDTREALSWKKAKKVAKMELLNRYILAYNSTRKQLIELNKTIRVLEEKK
jgi:hypothetical protein